MPTISQLPTANNVSAADEIPISQQGSVNAIAVGELLSTTQPAIIINPSSLLGRVSVGPGSPEEVELGTGVGISSGTLVANGGDHADYPRTPSLLLNSDLVISNQASPMLMPTQMLRGLYSAGQNITIDAEGVISSAETGAAGSGSLSGASIGDLQAVSSVDGPDIVPICQNGTDYGISYANFLDGLTIHQASSAGPATSSDVVWVGQGSDVLSRQSFTAIWSWISGQLAGYRAPVLELSSNTTLDGAIHNAAILVCSEPIKLSSTPLTLGSGFRCHVVNVSGGSVTLGSNFLTSSGSQMIAPQQAAEVLCLTYSLGTILYVSILGPSNNVSIPGQVGQLTASAITTTTISLAWEPSASGGVPFAYVVQIRLSGTTQWTLSVPLSTTTYLASSLSPETSYDFAIQATNAAGSGPLSAELTVSTLALTAAAAAPSQIAGVTATPISASSVDLAWSGQSGSSAATSFAVQYRLSGTASWTVAASGVTATTYTVSNLNPATGYDFSIVGMNSVGPSPMSTAVSVITPSVGNAVSSIVWNVAPSGTYTHSNGSIGVNANVTPSTAAVQFGFSASHTVAPGSWVAGEFVNSSLWGAYVPTPASAGNWYAWVEGMDGSSPTVYPAPFVVQ
jgi:hypothetical protein